MFVSADRDGFDYLREWRDKVVQVRLDNFGNAFLASLHPLKKLEHMKVLNKLETARLRSEYTMGESRLMLHPSSKTLIRRQSAELEIPGVRHFWYKSRRNVQITMPRWEWPYLPNSFEQKR